MQTATARTRTCFENILFATDFSTSADNAIPYVELIAKRYQSKVVALHVRPPVVNATTQPATWAVNVEAARALDQRHREDLLAMVPGLKTEPVIGEGDIQYCVDSAIRKYGIDLLVMGTRGRTGLGKILLGSVAEEIFRNVACPVLTVGPNADTAKRAKPEIRRILYATDLSPDAQSVAAYAVSLAQEYQAQLTLLHVIREQKVGELVAWPELEASAKVLLRKLVPPDAEAWCKPEYLVVRGEPSDLILEFAKAHAADLIVLGAQLEKGVPGAATHLPIATAHKVVSRATCPVLTVRHI